MRNLFGLCSVLSPGISAGMKDAKYPDYVSVYSIMYTIRESVDKIDPEFFVSFLKKKRVSLDLI